MKNILITLVLVVLSTIGLGQTPFKSLTVHIDTVQSNGKHYTENYIHTIKQK